MGFLVLLLLLLLLLSLLLSLLLLLLLLLLYIDDPCTNYYQYPKRSAQLLIPLGLGRNKQQYREHFLLVTFTSRPVLISLLPKTVLFE